MTRSPKVRRNVAHPIQSKVTFIGLPFSCAVSDLTTLPFPTGVLNLLLTFVRTSNNGLSGLFSWINAYRLTFRTNFREKMRSELSSWDEHKNYQTPPDLVV